jgi:hypothetical protein
MLIAVTQNGGTPPLSVLASYLTVNVSAFGYEWCVILRA